MLDVEEKTSSDRVLSIASEAKGIMLHLDERAEEIHELFSEHRAETKQKVVDKANGRITDKETYERMARVGVVLKTREFQFGKSGQIKGAYKELSLVVYKGYRKSSTLKPFRNQYLHNTILNGKTCNILQHEVFFYEQLITHINKHRRNVEDLKSTLRALAKFSDGSQGR